MNTNNNDLDDEFRLKRVIKKSVPVSSPECEDFSSQKGNAHEIYEYLESCDESLPEEEEISKDKFKQKEVPKSNTEPVDEFEKIITDNRISKIYNIDFSNTKAFIEKTQEIQEENSENRKSVIISCRFFLQFSKYERVEENFSLIACDLFLHPFLQSLHINITFLVQKEENYYFIPEHFPFFLENLKHLKTLDLISRFSFNSNNFFRNLARSLRGCSQLESLELHFYNDQGMDDSAFEILAEGLTFLTNLKTLRLVLDRCSITDIGMNTFLIMLPFMKELTTIIISLNENKNISDKTVKILANKLENHFKQRLKSFEMNVEKTRVRENGLSFILSVLFNFPNLCSIKIHADWSEIHPRIQDVFLKADTAKSLRALSFGCCWRNNDSSSTLSFLTNLKNFEVLRELSIDIYECNDYLELSWLKNVVKNSLTSVFSQINRGSSPRAGSSNTAASADLRMNNVSNALASLSRIRNLSLNFEINNKEFNCVTILDSIEKMEHLRNFNLRVLCKQIDFAQWEIFCSSIKKFSRLETLEIALSLPVLQKEEFFCLVQGIGGLNNIKSLKLFVFLEYHSRIEMEDWELLISTLSALSNLTLLHLSLRNFSLENIENPNIFFDFSSQLVERVFLKLKYLTDMKYFGPLPEIMTINQLPEFFLLKLIVDTQIAFAQRMVKARMLLTLMARSFGLKTFRLPVRDAIKNEIFIDFILPQIIENLTNYFSNPNIPDQRIIVQNNF